MIYVCTFDLINATQNDYNSVYTGLALRGYHQTFQDSAGNTRPLPNTTLVGPGQLADPAQEANAVRKVIATLSGGKLGAFVLAQAQTWVAA